jgi:small subunit ribosomal protein S1
MVLEIDEDKRRISLGMKQCKANPWEEFSANVKRGDKVKGPVKSITDFGVFIGLSAASTGWCTCPTCRGTSRAKRGAQLQEGPGSRSLVLAIDVERERISLGIKQLDVDPFTSFTTLNDRGAIVNGKVKSVDPRGAEIQLNEDVTATCALPRSAATASKTPATC